MKQELELRKEDLLTVVEEKSLGEILKPLVKEIHLFDTVIAGTSFIEDKHLYEALQEKEKLILQREGSREDQRHFTDGLGTGQTAQGGYRSVYDRDIHRLRSNYRGFERRPVCTGLCD